MHSTRPMVPSRPCPACGREVDPLRALAALATEDGIETLCDAQCVERFRLGERAEAFTPVLTSSAKASARPPAFVARPAVARANPVVEEGASTPWIGLAACVLGLLFGVVPGPLALAFVSAALTCFAALLALRRSVPSWKGVGALPWALAPAGVALAAIAGVIARYASEAEWVGLAGAAIAAAAALMRGTLDADARAPVLRVSERLVESLPRRVRIPARDPSDDAREAEIEVQTDRIRAGEEVLVHAGATVGVDGIVKSGNAQVFLFPSARTPVTRRAGDFVLAGARVQSGNLRLLSTSVGDDRALARPGRFGLGVGTNVARVARLAEQASNWGGFVVVAVAIGGLALASNAPGIASQLSAAAAVLLAAPLIAIRRAAEGPLVAAASAAAERGIVFPNARTLETAGRVSIAALCTHGTVTDGEPEVVDVHALDENLDVNALIALAAAAETAAEGNAIARAVRIFAEHHAIAPESVRRAVFLPGRGVTALSPGGEPFVIGNRQLLLDEGVSVALADAEAARAEARAHTALFVGLGGRVRAVVALQDAVRPGARAAVQRIFDLQVEAVLVSGDHRGTVEALARNLDVTHVKAELLPEERGAEVRRLRESGGTVAAIGRLAHDDAALAAADVPIALSAAGGPTSEHTVAVATEDPRDAAAALWIAKAGRQVAWRDVLIGVCVGAAVCAGSAFGWVPPAVAALLALGIDAFTLPAGARLLRRIDLRIPTRP